MKFCLDMHNIATDINSIPTRTTNISDSNYDTILHTHFTLVIKAYLMYTDENQDELLGQRQYLLYYRKLKSEIWDLTYGCGMCGYRVQIQLELRAEYRRKKYGRTNEIPSRHFNGIDKLAQRQWQNLCTTPINITNFSNYINMRLPGDQRAQIARDFNSYSRHSVHFFLLDWAVGLRLEYMTWS